MDKERFKQELNYIIGQTDFMYKLHNSIKDSLTYANQPMINMFKASVEPHEVMHLNSLYAMMNMLTSNMMYTVTDHIIDLVADNFFEHLKPIEFDCSELHKLFADKDDICPHCMKPFNPDF